MPSVAPITIIWKLLGHLHDAEHVERERGEEHADGGEDRLEDDAVPLELERLRDRAEEHALDERVERRQERRRLGLEDADHAPARSRRGRTARSSPGSRSGRPARRVVCDQPNAPPASTMRNRTNVLANVPFAVMCSTRVVGGGPAAASECASATGAAQPASSSFWMVSNRFSFSVGFAIVSSLGAAALPPEPEYGTLRRRGARSRAR